MVTCKNVQGEKKKGKKKIACTEQLYARHCVIYALPYDIASLNCHDTVVRQIEISPLERTRKFQRDSMTCSCSE